MRRSATLCNDGELHNVSILVRRVRCGRPGCSTCRLLRGHGRYAYAIYRDGRGRTRADYVGAVKIQFEEGAQMPVDSIQCPTPGCGKTLPVKKTKYGKPSMFCSDCGCQIMVRYQRGVEMWFGPEASRPAPAPRDPDPEPKEKPKADPPAPKAKSIWEL